MLHETPVIAVRGDSWIGLSVRPSVVSYYKHVPIELIGRWYLDGQSSCKDRELGCISIATFYNRSDPNNSIVDIYHTVDYFDIRNQILVA